MQEEKEKREQKHNFDRETNVSIRSQHDDVVDLNEIMEDRSDPNARLHQVRSHKRGEACVYSPASNDGKCLICKEEHFDCNFIAEPRCSTCYKSAEECPTYASKASYVIGKLLQLRKNDRDGKSNVSPLAARVYASAGNHRPLKVIVFSEFRDIYVSPWDVYGSAYSLSSL